jgi:hypothetical protein
VPPLTAALTIARHEGQGFDGGPSDHADDDVGKRRGEIASPSLLPGGDEWARPRVVDDGAAGACEREATTGALYAPPDRPGTRASAPLAHGRRDPDERRRA